MTMPLMTPTAQRIAAQIPIALPRKPVKTTAAKRATSAPEWKENRFAEAFARLALTLLGVSLSTHRSELVSGKLETLVLGVPA